MAKLTGLFKYDGTFQGVTTVDSRAYGKHIRKARTKFTLSKGMKVSSGLIKEANIYAKVFKDAIDPYRRDFRDGMLWQRLVSLFKNQLHEKQRVDFGILENQELNKAHPLNRIVRASAVVTQENGTLNVNVASSYTSDPTKGRADGYQKTLIILFIHEDMQVESFMNEAFAPLETDHEQQVSCRIPPAATTAVVVLKCNFSSGHKPLGLQKGMGMRVMKVISCHQQ